MSDAQAGNTTTEELVRYIVNQLSGRVGRTMILKLLYLADLEARRYLGRPLSRLSYRLYDHGPFDAALYPALDSLKEGGHIVEQAIQYPSGVGYLYATRSPGEAHALSVTDESILNFVVRTYASRDLQDVLDVVYSTEPMTRAKEVGANARIPMECVDNEARLQLGGIDLERALKAEDNVQEGRTVPWAELRHELLDRARGTGS